MPFFSKKPQKPGTKSDTPADGLNTDELSPAERAYLEDMERRASTEVKHRVRSAAEEQARREEIEQLQKNFHAQMPLYEPRTAIPANDAAKNQSAPVRDAIAERAAMQEARRQTLKTDPRYKEYYERLRRESERALADPSATSTSGMFRKVNLTPTPDTKSSPTSSNGDVLCSGCILHLDDDSIAIYKDAVSGKDYALLYFLEPDGRLDPRGIFLEQYEIKKLGQISDSLFNQMIERKRWERDPIIFHLDQYKYSDLIPTPPLHKSRAKGEPSGETSRRQPTTASQHDATSTRNSTDASGKSWRKTKSPTRPETQTGEQKGSGTGTRRDPMLERGRVFRINVGGRMWEAVYWTEDEMGAIVAHNTNKTWSLMHLNLGRFRDSIEYSDVLSYEQLSEIEQSLAQNPSS